CGSWPSSVTRCRLRTMSTPARRSPPPNATITHSTADRASSRASPMRGARSCAARRCLRSRPRTNPTRRAQPRRSGLCAARAITISRRAASRAAASCRTWRRSKTTRRCDEKGTSDVIELGVNIDHVATLRQARRTYEPDPVWGAVEAHLGGADGITVHLREDRRHIQDEDVRRLRELTHITLNLEMAAPAEMVAIACRLRPEMAMLVPEGRHEITPEGGLDICSQEKALKGAVAKLADAGIMTSVFIDAEIRQVEAAARI